MLHRLPSGKTIINSTIDTLRASGCTFVVVIRQNDTLLSAHLETLNVKTVQVTNADSGLSSAIAEAVSTSMARQLPWLGICLGDMPYINPKTYAELADHASPMRIVRPRYQRQLGHPVLFGHDYIPTLTTLTGDDGAKSVIKAYPDALQAMDVDDPMILHDIDRPSDIR